MKLTPMTWPPRAGYPQVPAWSVLVLTLMPLDEAEMGPPMVAPVRVMVSGPAATAALAAITTCGKVPVFVAVKPVGIFTPMEEDQ